MRVLRLDGSDEAKRAFAHMYQAVLAHECQGLEQLRRVSKIMDKLEAIGTKRTAVEGGQTLDRWQLQEGGGVLWLEDAEYNELSSRLERTNWLPQAARYVSRTVEMLEAAPVEAPYVEPKPAEPEAPAPLQAVS